MFDNKASSMLQFGQNTGLCTIFDGPPKKNKSPIRTNQGLLNTTCRGKGLLLESSLSRLFAEPLLVRAASELLLLWAAPCLNYPFSELLPFLRANSSLSQLVSPWYLAIQLPDKQPSTLLLVLHFTVPNGKPLRLCRLCGSVLSNALSAVPWHSKINKRHPTNFVPSQRVSLPNAMLTAVNRKPPERQFLTLLCAWCQNRALTTV